MYWVKFLPSVIISTLFLFFLLFSIFLWIMIRYLEKNDTYQKWQEYFSKFIRQHPKFYLLLGLLVSTCTFILFTIITIKTFFSYKMQLFDNLLIWAIQSFITPSITKIVILITTLGSFYFYLLVAPIIILFFFFLEKKQQAFSLLICLIGASALNSLLKHLFARPRPELLRLINETGYSFPSGHAMISICFYSMLAYILSDYLKSWQAKTILFIVTSFLIFLIGLSRVYLGVHYPSDVLAGYVAGSTWLFFCISLFLHYRKL